MWNFVSEHRNYLKNSEKMKITLLLLITISIAGNCHARPGSFTESVGESVSNTWHGVKRSFKSIFGKKPQPTTTLTTTTTTE